MKKVLIGLLLILTLFLMVGCANKNLSRREVTKILEENGFVKEDVKYTMEETADYDKFKNIYKFSNSIYEFDYFELEDKDYAIKLYEQNMEILEKYKGDSLSNEKNSDNYSRYTLEKDNNYHVLVRKGKTFLFGVVTIENKADFNDVLSLINY